MRWLRRGVLVAAWLTLLMSLLAWWALEAIVDSHWLGTLLAFGPRWVLLTPVLVLAPLALAWCRAALVPLAGSTIILLVPAMDCRLPLSHLYAANGPGPSLRVITINVGGRSETSRLVALVAKSHPDLIACQEWPAGVQCPLEPAGWNVVEAHGLLLASPHPLRLFGSLTADKEPWRTVALACDLHSSAGTFRCVCVHLTTPRPGLEAVLHRGWYAAPEINAVNARRRQESAATSDWIARSGGEIVLGDFNMIQQSRLYQTDWAPRKNAFSSVGWGYGVTKSTRRWLGVRIDHVICPPTWEVQSAFIGNDIGSDHLPLVVDLRPGTSSVSGFPLTALHR